MAFGLVCVASLGGGMCTPFRRGGTYSPRQTLALPRDVSGHPRIPLLLRSLHFKTPQETTHEVVVVMMTNVRTQKKNIVGAEPAGECFSYEMCAVMARTRSAPASS